MINFDNVLPRIGEFGFYQKRLCFFIFILATPNGIHIPSVIFNNVTPDYRCAIPGLNNDSFTVQDLNHASLVQASIPIDKESDTYSQCKTYYMEDDGSQPDENKTSKCHRWVFDESDGVYSQIVQFNLVCDSAMYKAHNSLMVLMGLLIGSLIGGTLSDYFGRKKTIFVPILVSSVLGALMAAFESFALIMVCRFLIVVSAVTHFLAGFVLLAETVGINKRSTSTIFAMMGFTAGLFVLVSVQYVFRDWRTAQLVMSLPVLALGLCWWHIQESPRWLLTKNRRKEAEVIIAYIAKVNKVTLPAEMEFLNEPVPAKSKLDEEETDEVTTESDTKDLKIWHICASKKYLVYLIILCISWVTINLVFYGLVLGVGDIIEGDIYINFILQSAMEIPSHLMCIFVLEKMGRKKIFCSTMLITGLATLGIGILVLADEDIRWLSITLYCLGKLFITIGFNLIYIITTELFPTKIRNSGLGFCSFVARFSGILSPYIINASLLIPGSFGKAFPVLLFGVLSLASGLSAILLPETRNAKLPESFNDRNDDRNNDTEKASKI